MSMRHVRWALIAALQLALLSGLTSCNSTRGGGQSGLGYTFPNIGWSALSEDGKARVRARAERYRAFVDEARTPRATALAAGRLMAAADHTALDLSAEGGLIEHQWATFSPRPKVFVAVKPGPKGAPMRVLIVPTDAPRLDVKQSGTYEKDAMVFFDTAYYGELDKRSWLNTPLALHGTWWHDGAIQSAVIGDDPSEPIFVVPDLLIHLSRKVQRERATTGEKLDAVAGFTSLASADAPADVQAGLSALGIAGADFSTGEFALIPAIKPTYLGVDRGLIAAYGQGHKVVLFSALDALVDVRGNNTIVIIGLDKGQLGLTGSTGESAVRDALGEVHARMEGEGASELGLRRVLHRSSALLASYNTAEIGHGVVLAPVGDDSLPEDTRLLVDAFDSGNVPYQFSLGGWSHARTLSAALGMPVMDIGVPIGARGEPVELVSVLDVDAMARAFVAFANAEASP